MGVSHRPGFGLLGSVPRSLSTQPPFATQALILFYDVYRYIYIYIYIIRIFSISQSCLHGELFRSLLNIFLLSIFIVVIYFLILIVIF